MPTLPLTIKIKDYTYKENITIPSVSVCTPPKILNPLTNKCETPTVVCTPPKILNPFTGKCEECTLPQIYNYITGKCETPEVICTPPQILNPFTGKCEECTPPKVYNYVTGKCETPAIVACTPPQILNPFTGKCEECTPPKVYNHVTGKCETPKVICTPPQILNPLTGKCEECTLPQIYNYVTGKCETPAIVVPKVTTVRIVKILPEDERRLPDANAGETIKITATVICKSADVISRPRDTAYLIIDGAIADRKTIENGIVTFDWEATAVPINIHNICIKVDPSTNCKSPGQDCKRITVSLTSLGIAEQLAKERASSSEQRKLLEQARSRLREEIIGAELQVPGYETPVAYIPPTYEIPIITTPSTTPPTSEPTPTQPSQPEYGDISIVGLPALILPITPETPIYIYIDDKSVGRLYELPKTTTVSIGTHSVYARAGDITTPAKTVFVTKDKTTTVTL